MDRYRDRQRERERERERERVRIRREQYEAPGLHQRCRVTRFIL